MSRGENKHRVLLADGGWWNHGWWWGGTNDKHGEVRNAYEILFGIHDVKGVVENLRCKLEDGIRELRRMCIGFVWPTLETSVGFYVYGFELACFAKCSRCVLKEFPVPLSIIYVRRNYCHCHHEMWLTWCRHYVDDRLYINYQLEALIIIYS